MRDEAASGVEAAAYGAGRAAGGGAVLADEARDAAAKAGLQGCGARARAPQMS